MTEERQEAIQKVDPQMEAQMEAISKIVLEGDLSSLTVPQRALYVKMLCEELRISWKVQPFDWLILDKKLVLYPRRSFGEQIRKRDKVKVEVTFSGFPEGMDDVYMVQVMGTTADGRSEPEIGAAPCPPGAPPEVKANAVKKAMTQAKRRLSIALGGLGLPDESELGDIPKDRVSFDTVQRVAPRQIQTGFRPAAAEAQQPVETTIPQVVEAEVVQPEKSSPAATEAPVAGVQPQRVVTPQAPPSRSPIPISKPRAK